MDVKAGLEIGFMTHEGQLLVLNLPQNNLIILSFLAVVWKHRRALNCFQGRPVDN